MGGEPTDGHTTATDSDAAGRTIVVRTVRHTSATDGYDLVSREQKPNGLWGPDQIVKTDVGSNPFVQVGVDDAGNATAVFRVDDRIMYAYRAVGGDWTAAQQLNEA